MEYVMGRTSILRGRRYLCSWKHWRQMRLLDRWFTSKTAAGNIAHHWQQRTIRSDRTKNQQYCNTTDIGTELPAISCYRHGELDSGKEAHIRVDHVGLYQFTSHTCKESASSRFATRYIQRVLEIGLFIRTQTAAFDWYQEQVRRKSAFTLVWLYLIKGIM